MILSTFPCSCLPFVYLFQRNIYLKPLSSFFFLSYLFIIDCTGFCTVCGLSLVAASGSYSLVAEHRHLIAVVSLLHSMGSRHVGSVVVATGLVALWRVESSWIRDWTCVPCIGRCILNHWTTSGITLPSFLIVLVEFLLLNCISSSCILDASLLSVWFTNVLSHSMHYFCVFFF